jgi:hypothetical protein
MSDIPAAEVDPVVAPAFTIDRRTKVATAGSCFAQHISRALKESGFNHLVVEEGSSALDAEERQKRQYGVFSARYGNIYTARQLRQLVDRAYGRFTPADSAWRRPDGRVLDPFRPSVEPEGFATVAELEADRAVHLAAVKRMFETLDVFVFTLGLTEAWEAVVDGAVFPIAPGVVAPTVDMSQYRFVNYNAETVAADLDDVLAKLTDINPSARAILTVSPVPLVATYENRHVLVSTTLSKGVLRVAAESAVAHCKCAVYFPSFEIVTGAHAHGAYFEADLRSVTPDAVDHVMRLFLAHYGNSLCAVDDLRQKKRSEPARPAKDIQPAPALLAEYRAGVAISCDEESLDA